MKFPRTMNNWDYYLSNEIPEQFNKMKYEIKKIENISPINMKILGMEINDNTIKGKEDMEEVNMMK